MTFLDCQPDLTNTVFNQNDLNIAREHLSSIIAEIDPPWQNKPIGMLGAHWKSDSLPSVCFLINTAMAIDTLARGFTQKSEARLKKKFKELLRSPEDQFQENYNEFQAGKMLVQLFDHLCPLHFLENTDIIEPKVARCPDFLLRLPDGDIFLDATVFYGGILDAWTQASYYITSGLEKYALQQESNMLDVSLSLPLRAEMDEKEILELILQEVQKNRVGRIAIGTKGLVKWNPVSIITLPPPFEDFDEWQKTYPEFPLQTEFVFQAGQNTIDRAFISKKSIIFASEEDKKEAADLLFKSLKNKLREKRGQFPKVDPEVNLLILTLAHDQLYESDIVMLLQSRIWPNKEYYNWLSGVIIFTPQTHFSPSDRKDHMTLCPNPHAYRPVTNSFRNAFKS